MSERKEKKFLVLKFEKFFLGRYLFRVHDGYKTSQENLMIKEKPFLLAEN